MQRGASLQELLRGWGEAEHRERFGMGCAGPGAAAAAGVSAAGLLFKGMGQLDTSLQESRGHERSKTPKNEPWYFQKE